MAFKIAASMGFKERQQGFAVLLSRYERGSGSGRVHGTIIGDLNSRRGRLKAWSIAPVAVINSLVPLARMFGTATNMSSTQGRATFSMHFAHYDEAPRS